MVRRGRLNRSAAYALLLTVLALVLVAIPLARSSTAADLSTGFRLPYPKGTSYTVTQNWNGSTSHTGNSKYAYDFGMPEGTPVVAAARGTVKFVHKGETACGSVRDTYINKANYVVIYHSDGSATMYGHLKTVDVNVDDVVAPGQRIGLSGKTGYTFCDAHLHFARQEKGSAFEPSIAIYFEEKPGVELGVGTKTVSENPGCSHSLGSLPVGSFCGKYFSGLFSGPEWFSKVEYPISFSWPSGYAGGYWLDDNANFSGRWMGKFSFAAGWYDFSWRTSDGIRLFVDDMTTPVWSDGWTPRTAPASGKFGRYMSLGTHTIKVEFFDSGGGEAAAKMTWAYRCDSSGPAC